MRAHLPKTKAGQLDLLNELLQLQLDSAREAERIAAREWRDWHCGAHPTECVECDARREAYDVARKRVDDLKQETK